MHYLRFEINIVALIYMEIKKMQGMDLSYPTIANKPHKCELKVKNKLSAATSTIYEYKSNRNTPVRQRRRDSFKGRMTSSRRGKIGTIRNIVMQLYINTTEKKKEDLYDLK
ncbi:hypothetical protein V1478_001463 [Vespula squamosa]|uniref:Uncharacterized protein n=1 Tax=Vespula squamosa TaxID=30214 RepID=A0ABD2C1I3_VESSQ